MQPELCFAENMHAALFLFPGTKRKNFASAETFRRVSNCGVGKSPSAAPCRSAALRERWKQLVACLQCAQISMQYLLTGFENTSHNTLTRYLLFGRRCSL